MMKLKPRSASAELGHESQLGALSLLLDDRDDWSREVLNRTEDDRLALVVLAKSKRDANLLLSIDQTKGQVDIDNEGLLVLARSVEQTVRRDALLLVVRLGLSIKELLGVLDGAGEVGSARGGLAETAKARDGLPDLEQEMGAKFVAADLLGRAPVRERVCLA